MPTLDWIGKKAVVNHHREVPYRLVHCNGERSAGDPDAENLLVQGDNLEALKALLPYYAGKVKCIYIDPPYNTGNEGWVYNDNVASPEIKAWLGKVVGKEAEDLSRHDKWLCMMYPRLRLLREFLREDGIICVSIDDAEVHHMRILLDEVFGGSNFIASLAVQKRYSRENRGDIGDAHEYVLIFARNYSLAKGTFNRVPLDEKSAAVYKNPNDDPRGRWRGIPLTAQAGHATKEQFYEITAPGGKTFTPPPGRCWGVSKATFERYLEEGRIYFGKNNNSQPNLIRYLSEVDGLVPWTWWPHQDAGHTDEAKKEVMAFGFDGEFDTPKPIRLIRRLLQITTNPGDLVLDSFAGSGTTGHAVLDLNKQGEGNRQFILVEMDKKIAPEITSERLRRVINGYDKGGDPEKPVEALGGGFRYCHLGTPLFNEFGDIDEAVIFPDLAAHVFFSETGAPLPKKVDGSTPLIGSHKDKIVYLLFSPAEQGFPREAAGNVLTPDALAYLPAAPEGFEGERVVYAEGCTVSPERLKAEGVVFKQIPYQIEGA
ncbi:putative methyltransferase [Phaeobacter italicus]|uniref:site-specific DNA-methyltransferase (adenine-specific) n=1 Tax=Phaeobacter italicus TaxID=481446 RepID=A0A0H5D5A3_9RHOB|nr:site-specific DNA-methyltransferase [Phaeobacter italicus]CRL12276.1 putative methyltransferase [Phaeobacter italicus]